MSRTPGREDPYLISPLTGYPLTVTDDLADRAISAHARLRQGGELGEVAAAARLLSSEDPGFHPAQVLAAQVAYVRHEDQAAIDLLRPVADELPSYPAAQLLLGRVLERSGDLPNALRSFARLAETVTLAKRRAEEIRPRAIEIVLHRLRDELDRGHVEEAEAHLAWLEEWAADSVETLHGGWLVAVEKGDLEGELERVRGLAAATGERRFREREGVLEVKVGDVSVGLAKLEALSQQYPDDAGLVDQLELAKFLWRVQLLPPQVQEIGRKGELDRADFASLLYWLVPRVRYSRISNPPIATDILDHPRRDEILRVLNLRLLEVDETLHHFEPATPASRAVVFKALLELLASADARLSCVADHEALALDSSWRTVCREAAGCRLIPEVADCRPGASISGPEVLELFRHTLDLLGS